jgi:hypothetical protein
MSDDEIKVVKKDSSCSLSSNFTVVFTHYSPLVVSNNVVCALITKIKEIRKKKLISF